VTSYVVHIALDVANIPHIRSNVNPFYIGISKEKDQKQ